MWPDPGFKDIIPALIWIKIVEGNPTLKSWPDVGEKTYKGIFIEVLIAMQQKSSDLINRGFPTLFYTKSILALFYDRVVDFCFFHIGPGKFIWS